ncbi:MAG: 3-deoxy-8-phosphooctulonate synthase [Candidatus Levybacteria bacterium]|nr:3-deoxy-8-phosphooctulonate synthase [Candidatus Levybacteria bacterium]
MNVKINNIIASNKKPFILIAGPDSIESLDHAMLMAKSINKIAKQFQIPYVFKASYDKANRTSVTSFRGVGMEEGVKILTKIQDTLKIPVTTDVHTVEQAEYVGKFINLIQVPALLSRQTDLLVAAGKTKKAVNIKKGQFIAPQNANNLIGKVTSTGNTNVLITERGTTFGYNDVVTDMRGLEIMKRFGYPVIFDASHTVQFPSNLGNKSGGDRSLIPALAKAAIAVGIAGIFMEIHNNPSKAPVDGLSSLDLKDLKGLLRTLKSIDKIVKNYE